MRVRDGAAAALGCLSIVAAAACGGGRTSHAGAAAAAVAEYWKQEQAGGRLPEGTEVLQSGVQSPVKLKTQSGDKERYCVVFKYLEHAPPQTTHSRVYIARLQGDAWLIETQKPDGNCDGIS